MPRPKKEYKPVSIKLDKSKFDLLEMFCEATYLTKTAAIEKALDEMFDREGYKLKDNNK